MIISTKMQLAVSALVILISAVNATAGKEAYHLQMAQYRADYSRPNYSLGAVIPSKSRNRWLFKVQKFMRVNQHKEWKLSITKYNHNKSVLLVFKRGGSTNLPLKIRMLLNKNGREFLTWCEQNNIKIDTTTDKYTQCHRKSTRARPDAAAVKKAFMKRGANVVINRRVRTVVKGGLTWKYKPADVIMVKSNGYNLDQAISSEIQKQKEKGKEISDKKTRANVLKSYSGLKGAVTKDVVDFQKIIKPNLKPYSVKHPDSLILLTGSHHYLFDAVKVPTKTGVRQPTGVTRVKDLDNDEKEYPSIPISPLITVNQFIKEINTSTEPIKFKGKIIKKDVIQEYLESLTDKPDKTRIQVLREVQRHVPKQLRKQKVGKMAKPAWASGIILKINDERRQKYGRQTPMVKYMLDFGTQKVALTDNDGCQILDLYGDYEKTGVNDITLTKGQYDIQKDKNTGIVKFPNANKTITVTEYFKRLQEFLEGHVNDAGQPEPLSFNNVAARFTGAFRNITKGTDLEKRTGIYFRMLDQRKVERGFLKIEDEAQYGSQHTLDIISPYIAEYNGKCFQMRKELQASPKYKKATADQQRRMMNALPRPILKVLILESGSGSIQGLCYELVSRQRRRLKAPLKGIDALESLLEECRAAGYKN